MTEPITSDNGMRTEGDVDQSSVDQSIVTCKISPAAMKPDTSAVAECFAPGRFGRQKTAFRL